MKPSFTKLSLLALPVFALTACQDYDPLGEEGMAIIQNQKILSEKINEYTTNFECRYGTIDPSHDWGMFMTVNMEGKTRSAVTERNMWVDQFHLIVPGWPDTYYKEGDNTEYSNGYHNLDNSGNNPSYSTTEPHGNLPAGDVTDEEIQYVSWWFRTHQYPESVKLHWTDFYVQGISADNDRNPDGTIINTLNHYEPINGSWEITGTDLDVTYSIDYFSAELLQKDVPTSDPGAWDHINNYNRGSSNQLDPVEDLPMNGEDWKTTLDSDNKNSTVANLTNRLMMFYHSSGTENFRAHYAQDSSDRDWLLDYTNDGQAIPGSGHSSWVLVHLTFTGKSGRLYDGYYLAFDYQCYKQESADSEGNLTKYTLHPADGYYSNWIFKLSPALPSVEPKYASLSRRIMCEDLGNTFDFDFNDVVFDATYNITEEQYNQYLNGTKTDSPIDVTIRLQAAGGTLPIYVGTRPSGRSAELEAHFLLGNHRSDTPINVNAPSGAESPVAIYHYQLEFPSGLSTEEQRLQALSLNNIPIFVQSPDNKGTYLTSSGSYWGNEYTSESNHPTPENKGKKSAPRAFGVPVGVCWMNECKFIETSYTRFDDWVRDQATWGDDSSTPWYMTDVQNTSYIYSYVAYVKPEGPSGPDYSVYGQQINVTKGQMFSNPAYFLSVSDFEADSEYDITIIVEAQNAEWTQNNYSIKMVSDGNAVGENLCSSHSKELLDSDKSYAAKAILRMPSSVSNYNQMYIEINGIKEINAVCIKKK